MQTDLDQQCTLFINPCKTTEVANITAPPLHRVARDGASADCVNLPRAETVYRTSREQGNATLDSNSSASATNALEGNWSICMSFGATDGIHYTNCRIGIF